METAKYLDSHWTDKDIILVFLVSHIREYIFICLIIYLLTYLEGIDEYRL